jgi:hypothetical protein
MRRWVLAGAALIILLAIAIPGYGYYKEVIRLGDSTALTVDGQTFTLEQYARYAGTRRDMVSRQIAQVQPLAIPSAPSPPVATSVPTTTVPNATPGLPTTPAPIATPGPTQVAAQQTLQQLQSEQDGLTSSGLSDLVEAKLVADEGQTRGITVTQAELDDALRWMMSPPSPSSFSEQGLKAAPVSGTFTPTVSLDDAKASLATIIAPGKLLTADQVNDLILRPAVIKTKLVAALAGNDATTAEQVHARQILVATEDQAIAARKELDAGADFAAVAAKYSTDTGSKDKGGDLGWFGKGVMIPEFETVAFSLKPGEISQPVKSQFGYHIIQVLEKDPNHPLDAAALLQAKEKGYQTWLSKGQSDSSRVTYGQTSAKTTDWVKNYVDSAG